ncbi:NAD-dependent epimerase/dehydratase family protein [Streptomyces sp. NPDC048416]|uniref:NAD-dependent epimerase/dehydratase family protein n=1 Tax=Streptomyces sp. NPDC048416 TaxID=3365546 RepID=UPI0037138C4C
MRLLVIGGTVFLGRAFVADALARGWEVTTFHRGRSGSDLPGVETILGDRENEADLARVAAAGPFDAVVDVCGYVPRTVGASARALSPRAGAYLYISSINALRPWPAAAVDESSVRFECSPDAGPDDGQYPALKAGCERAVERDFDGRVLVLRPGVVIGPGDRMRRVPYWLRRATQGGRMLAAGAPERTMQLIDARDIAAFGLDRIAAGGSGTYLTTGEPANATWGELVEHAVELTGAGTEPVWVPDAFLATQQIPPFVTVPFWAPPMEALAGVWDFSSKKALADGLRCRPFADSVRDTWTWMTEQGGMEEAFAEYRYPDQTLTREREAEILAAWDARETG